MKESFVEVLGSKMHYIEEGEGDPVLFLHGVPASGYVWRNLMPYMASVGRCIAPDLIGFGQSEKPDIQYSVFDHIKYIEAFINKLNLENITIVMHGWGSVIGFSYAAAHQDNCKGLAFYEPFLRSIDVNEEALPFREQIDSLQNDTESLDLIMNSSFFVDKTLAQDMMKELSEEDLEVYRKPFKEQGSGKPIVQYLKEVPLEGDEGEINQLIRKYTEFLKESSLPKLFLYSVPGFITTFATIMWAKAHLPELQIVEVGEELHYAQESYPELMGSSISAWLQAVEQLQK